ncbi:MAG: hypothetical protein JO053_16015 [Acidobacteria bacterium]|nr:hypothetical protein [Acidobacteriota bacterium]
MNEHEKMFVRSFVTSSKRERYLEQFGSEKGRRKLTAALDHFADLDVRWTKAIPSDLQTPQAISELLLSKGAPLDCFVLSSNADLDGKEIKLKDALDQTVGYGAGTYISCVPGKLGYFESSDISDRVILEKR